MDRITEIIENTFPIAEDDHIELPNGAALNDILKESLPKQMALYAKEQAIAFAKWSNKHFVYVDDDLWDGDNDETWHISDIYEKFLQSQSPTTPLI